jgi:hypothetical protein
MTQRPRWQDVFRSIPEPARQLTVDELARIHHNISPALARDLAHPVCPHCQGRTNGQMHRDLCETRVPPARAAVPIRQPWMPKAPRHRRAA